ncbi:unnamed protein product [Heterobilharzia americana]|nr:unnamed protein product [Heterobilharzia americana]
MACIIVLKRSNFDNNSSTSKLRSYVKTEDKSALDLLEMMIRFNPKKRITAFDALSLPYFHLVNSTTSNTVSVSIQNNIQHIETSLHKPLLRNNTSLSRPNGRMARYSMNTVHPTQSCAAALSSYLQNNNNNMPSSVHLRSCLVGAGIDEIDGRIQVSNAQPKVDTILSASSYSHLVNCTPITNSMSSSSCTSDSVDQHQQNLIISVVNNAINETSIPSCLSLDNTVSSSALLTRRPLTRQQTRSVRRHTQPATSYFIESNQVVSSNIKIVNQKTQKNSTDNKPSIKTDTINSVNTTNRVVRQRKTARRRTVMGVVQTSNSSNKEVKQTNLTGNKSTRKSKEHMPSQSVTVKGEETAVSLVGTLPYVALNREEIYCSKPAANEIKNVATKPVQHRGRISERCPNLVSQYTDHRYQSHIRPSSRYSLGPIALSNPSLHSIHEHEKCFTNNTKLSTDQQISSIPCINPHISGLNEVEKYSSSSSSPSIIVGLTENQSSTTLCSPSKLARVINQHPPLLESLNNVNCLKELSQHFTNKQDITTYEDDTTTDEIDSDDIENQPANTSLGINTAMTDLALVSSHSNSNSNSSQYKNSCIKAKDNMNRVENSGNSFPMTTTTTIDNSATASLITEVPALSTNVTVQLTACSIDNIFV